MAKLPKSIIKKYGITKKAWAVFRSGRSQSSRKARHKIGGSKMTRRRSYRRIFGRRRGGGGRSMTRTAFKVLRIGALVAPAAYYATMPGWDTQRKLNNIILSYGGFDFDDMQWKPSFMVRGWGAYLGACLATYGIPKLTSIIRKL